LSQTTDPKVVEFAKAAAVQLGLTFEHRHVGVQGLAHSIPVTFLSPINIKVPLINKESV
jgi:hypothetical protein